MCNWSDTSSQGSDAEVKLTYQANVADELSTHYKSDPWCKDNLTPRHENPYTST